MIAKKIPTEKLTNGKIIESGSHEQLMKLDGQYATLFKLQAKGYQ